MYELTNQTSTANVQTYITVSNLFRDQATLCSRSQVRANLLDGTFSDCSVSNKEIFCKWPIHVGIKIQSYGFRFFPSGILGKLIIYVNNLLVLFSMH